MREEWNANRESWRAIRKIRKSPERANGKSGWRRATEREVQQTWDRFIIIVHLSHEVSVWIHWTIVRPNFNKNKIFWVNFEAPWNENESECETSGQKEVYILSDNIINDIQDIKINGGGDRVSNRCLKWNHVTTEQVADHVARAWYRQYGAWLGKGILFSIEWYHLIPFMTIRYWFKAVWT